MKIILFHLLSIYYKFFRRKFASHKYSKIQSYFFIQKKKNLFQITILSQLVAENKH